MNLSQMLYEMCHDVLSLADIKAICKSRGFSDKEAESRSLFENVFLSSIGVEGAMKTLTDAEAAALHLLSMEDRVVDVTFFERLYGRKQEGWRAYGTFTQQFKPVFDAVQRNLIRKGLLVISEANTNALNKTKMELWHYRFPPEFGPFLPPLVHPVVHADQAGDIHADKLRTDLGRLTQTRTLGTQRPPAIQLSAGGLTLGTRPFSTKAVRDWRQSAWQADILTADAKRDKVSGSYPQAAQMYKGYLLPSNEYRTPSPLPVALYAFARLAPHEWIAPGQLDTLLDVLYAGPNHPSSSAICQAGWDNGCLVRYRADGTDYYRLAGDEGAPADDAPDGYLSIADGKVFVDLDKVPYEALDLLNRVATLTVEGGRLRVSPHIVKMVDALDSAREHAVIRYLKAHSAEFRAAFKRIDAQWGRLIIHENLLVARVTDLSLRVKLQQAFGGADGAPSARLVALSDEYIAFPRAMLGDIEKMLKKAGHVVKTVHAA